MLLFFLCATCYLPPLFLSRRRSGRPVSLSRDRPQCNSRLEQAKVYYFDFHKSTYVARCTFLPLQLAHHIGQRGEVMPINPAEFWDSFPKGTILPFAGDLTHLPHGWEVCDGNNGTV